MILFAQLTRTWGIGELAVFIIIAAALCGVVFVATKAMGAVIAILAVRFLLSL